MEMWSLITISSAGHLHRTKSLAGVVERERQHPEPVSVFLTNVAFHSGVVFLTV